MEETEGRNLLSWPTSKHRKRSERSQRTRDWEKEADDRHRQIQTERRKSETTRTGKKEERTIRRTLSV
jgi:hypothetical protein